MAAEHQESLTTLLQLALEGDAHAYAQFLDELATRLRPSLTQKMRQIGASHDVEDIVQDILIAVHNKRHTYDRSRPVLPWARAIAHYKWVDFVRSNLRRPYTVEVDDISLLPDTFNQETQSTAAHDIEHFLGQLPTKQADLVRLAKLEGKTMAEIADHTHQSIPAVKVNLHRAMHKLKNLALLSRAKGGE